MFILCFRELTFRALLLCVLELREIPTAFNDLFCYSHKETQGKQWNGMGKELTFGPTNSFFSEPIFEVELIFEITFGWAETVTEAIARSVANQFLVQERKMWTFWIVKVATCTSGSHQQKSFRWYKVRWRVDTTRETSRRGQRQAPLFFSAQTNIITGVLCRKATKLFCPCKDELTN